jgi:sulfotransferase family protein
MPLATRPPRPHVHLPPAPFVVGVPRSGTTLLRLMLDAHPRLTIPPETYFLPELLRTCKAGDATPQQVMEVITATRRWPDFQLEPSSLLARLPAGRPVKGREAARAFYAAYAESLGKPRWGDKTPVYLKNMLAIQKALPEARFIHIIRDGRDVALSVLGLMFGPDSVDEAARRWRRKVLRARQQAARLRHYREVHYEDLVADPEPTLRSVCEYIELPWDPAMLDYPRHAAERMAVIARRREREGLDPIPAGYGPRIHALTSEPPQGERVGRWRAEMAPADRAAYEQRAGDLLAALGYEVQGGR